MPKQLSTIRDLFTEKEYVSLIQKKLPNLFSIAGIESSRAGKEGMQVGSLRENVIIALLLYAFGDKRANPEFAITETEKDIEIDKKPISIKTIKGGGGNGIKAVWTVDEKSIGKWLSEYKPKMDIILAQICWGSKNGGLFLIPAEVQIKVFDELGIEKYMRIPTGNFRGVEFSKDAINRMLSDKRTLRIEIDWVKSDIPLKNIYKRWIDYWTS